MKECELIDPGANKTAVSQTLKDKSHPIYRYRTDNRTLNQVKECPPQATPVAWSLSKQQRASAIHITLPHVAETARPSTERTNRTDKVGDDQAHRAFFLLNVASENQKKEHVAGKMIEVCVAECICDKLPPACCH
jgi:hypothetical protein